MQFKALFFLTAALGASHVAAELTTHQVIEALKLLNQITENTADTTSSIKSGQASYAAAPVSDLPKTIVVLEIGERG